MPLFSHQAAAMCVSAMFYLEAKDVTAVLKFRISSTAVSPMTAVCNTSSFTPPCMQEAAILAQSSFTRLTPNADAPKFAYKMTMHLNYLDVRNIYLNS